MNKHIEAIPLNMSNDLHRFSIIFATIEVPPKRLSSKKNYLLHFMSYSATKYHPNIFNSDILIFLNILFECFLISQHLNTEIVIHNIYLVEVNISHAWSLEANINVHHHCKCKITLECKMRLIFLEAEEWWVWLNWISLSYKQHYYTHKNCFHRDNLKWLKSASTHQPSLTIWIM